MPADRIAKLLEDIRLVSPERFALVQTLREIILDLDASITEEIKYGGFLFSADKSFCGIFSYTKHVSLEFGEGATCVFQTKVATDSRRSLPPIPRESCH